MTHELVDKESVVFSQGDEGTTFYIIYKGAATVYVPDEDREKGQGSLGQAATALQSLARRRGSVVTADGLRLARQQTCVCMLEDGDSFGELAPRVGRAPGDGGDGDGDALPDREGGGARSEAPRGRAARARPPP